MLGHKTNLSKFKKTEITSSIFSDHNTRKPEINYKKNCKKHKHTEVKQYAANQWITEEIKEELKKYLETNENKNIIIQNLCDTANAVLRGKLVIQAYLRKQKKNSNKKPNLIPKRTKKSTNKTQS